MNFTTRFLRGAAILWIALIALSAVRPAQAQTVIYDSPAQNFITGIDGLQAGNRFYNVTFHQGSFDDVFGIDAMTADLTFQGYAAARPAY